jgi:hypothetical protein
MNSTPERFNIATIRNLLKDAFTAQDLWRFCQERPDFQPVLVHFPYNATQAQMIDALTEYCRTHVLFEQLLVGIRLSNPRQYKRYQAQLHGGTGAPLPSSQIPHNLPPRSDFVGRDAEKARIHAALHLRPNLGSIDGMGGIGKTALALEVAHECLAASRDQHPVPGIATFAGLVWITAKEHEITLNGVFDTIARTLGYPGIAEKPISEKEPFICQLLQGGAYLVILDNLETIHDPEVMRFLNEIPEPSRAVVTTRKKIKSLGGAWMLSLVDLDQDEALALMRSEGRRLGLPAVERAKDQILEQLYQSTSGAPLAIKWAVGQIKQKGQSLDTVLTALRRAKASIFQNIFATSWGLLSAEARQVLAVMPLFAAPASWSTLEAASDVHGERLQETLGQLVEMSLLDATDELLKEHKRYSAHPLTRAYIRAALRGDADFAGGALERLLAYYTEFLTPPDSVRVGTLYWDGLLNYTIRPSAREEWNNISNLIRKLLREGRGAEALKLFLQIVHFLGAWGLWQERLDLGQPFYQMAEASDDPAAAWLQIDAIGWVLRQRGQMDDCARALQQGRCVAERLAIDYALILADAYEARLYTAPDEQDRALKKVERALSASDPEMALRQGSRLDRVIAARVVDAAAALRQAWGDPEGAKEYYELELALRRSVGEYTASIVIRLARLDLELGEVASAVARLEGLQTGLAWKDTALRAYLQALIFEHQGDVAGAQAAGSLALEQFTRLGMEQDAKECRDLLADLPD